MSTTSDPLSYEEHPAFFQAAAETLFGVVTHPPGRRDGATVTMLTGGGFLTSTHRNRLYVRLGRRLAAHGHSSFRFDYHGTGESTGTVEQFSLNNPFLDDLAGAINWLDVNGATSHVLVGSCFGSRTVLAGAPGIANLAGLLLLSPPVRDFYFDPDRGDFVDCDHDRENDTASLGFLEPLGRLVERGVPVLVVFGDQDSFYADFQRAKAGALGGILEAAGPLVEVRVLPCQVHPVGNLQVQDMLVELILEWLGPREGAPVTAATPARTT